MAFRCGVSKPTKGGPATAPIQRCRVLQLKSRSSAVVGTASESWTELMKPGRKIAEDIFCNPEEVVD